MRRIPCPTCGTKHRAHTDDDRPLPREQRRAWEVINELCKYPRPPTTREIAERLGVSYTMAYEHIKALHAKGYISKTDNEFRTIQITRIPQ